MRQSRRHRGRNTAVARSDSPKIAATVNHFGFFHQSGLQGGHGGQYP